MPGEPERSISFVTPLMWVVGRERHRIADEIGRIAFEEVRRIMEFGRIAKSAMSSREREVNHLDRAG